MADTNRALVGVAHVLRRVRTDPDLYHHLAFTQSLAELVGAFVALGGDTGGLSVQETVDKINQEPPPGRPRCAREQDDDG